MPRAIAASDALKRLSTGTNTTPHHTSAATATQRTGHNRQRQSAASGTFGSSVSLAARCPSSMRGVCQSKRRVRSVASATNRFGAVPARRKPSAASPAEISPRVSLKGRANAVYARLVFGLAGPLQVVYGRIEEAQKHGVSFNAARIDARLRNPAKFVENRLPSLRKKGKSFMCPQVSIATLEKHP